MICQLCPLCGANLDPGERCDCGDFWMSVELPPYAENREQTDGKEAKLCRAN